MNLYHKVIKHKANKDICYYVAKCFDAGHKIILSTEIMNMGYVDSWFLNVKPCRIVIKKEDYENWFVCADTKVRCLRDSKWVKL